LAMIHQYRDGVVPGSSGDPQIAQLAAEAVETTSRFYEKLDFSKAIETVWGLIGAVDKFIVEKAPWKLAKDPNAAAELDNTLYTAAEALRVVTALLSPVIPASAAKIWSQLGFVNSLDTLRVENLKWGGLPSGQKLGAAAAVFPRAEAKPSIEKMRQMEA